MVVLADCNSHNLNTGSRLPNVSIRNIQFKTINCISNRNIISIGISRKFRIDSGKYYFLWNNLFAILFDSHQIQKALGIPLIDADNSHFHRLCYTNKHVFAMVVRC